MNCPDCDAEVHGQSCRCGWVMPGTKRIVLSSPAPEPHANGVGRDDFGQTLYKAVHAIGEIKQLRILRGRVAMGELPDAGYKDKEHGMIQELAQLLTQLDIDDVVSINKKYPWVAGL